MKKTVGKAAKVSKASVEKKSDLPAVEIDKFELDSYGELERIFENLDMEYTIPKFINSSGDMDIKTTSPVKFKTEKIEIEGTGSFVGIQDRISNIPLEFIVYPFFTKNKQRLVNFQYEIKDLGLTMYSKINEGPEGLLTEQPSTFEEAIFDYLLTRFQYQLESGIDKEYIYFDLESFIVEFLGNKMNTQYYIRVENALSNMKYTTYLFDIKNYKKAGGFMFEDDRFSLINYKKARVGRKTIYRVKLDDNIIKKMRQKRFIKIKAIARQEIASKDGVALRIYQYISMIRMGKSEDEVRIEVLAAVIPLKTFEKKRVKLASGEVKEYKISKLKKVLKRVEEAFQILKSLNYLSEYKIITRLDDDKWNISYKFGDKEGLISTYLPKKEEKKAMDYKKVIENMEITDIVEKPV